MNEITVISEDGDVIAHVFNENGEIRAIVKNGYEVAVDGEELEIEVSK